MPQDSKGNGKDFENGANPVAITSWPAGERPRERLLERGAENLSAAELIAIILRTGSKGETAVALAKRLVAEYSGNLVRLFSARPEELARVRGIGLAKAVQMNACFEMSHRLMRSQSDERPVLKSAEDVFALVRQRMRALPQEHFVGLFLNRRNKLLREETISVGGSDGANFHVQDLFRRALLAGATSLVLVHNHPSGDPLPSRQDVRLTNRVAQGGEVLGISLLDLSLIHI